MKVHRNTKQILGNWLYNLGGIAIMNAVLQFIIFPSMNMRLGSEKLGIALYLTGFVSILTPAFGQAVMNMRLVSREKHQFKNGDFNAVVLIFCIIAILITLIIAHQALGDFMSSMLISGILLLTTWRYYAAVEFRMSLKFNRYFIYNIILSIGYLAGYGLFISTNNWTFIFLIGEFAALCYVWLKGNIFQRFWSRSSSFIQVLKSSIVLALSSLFFNLSLQFDRIVLKLIVSNMAVSEYYVVSLIGKSLVLLIAPVNAIILSYLPRKEEPINRKTFGLYIGTIFLGATLFLGICQLAVPIFIQVLYPDMYDSVIDLVFIANLAQILSVASTSIFAIVLTFLHEKWQLILQSIHIALLAALAIPLTSIAGVRGFAYAAVIANSLRIISVIIVGMLKSQD